MLRLLVFLFCLNLIACRDIDNSINKVEIGSITWRGVLVLSEDRLIKLPFIFEYNLDDTTNNKFTIVNAEERIELTNVQKLGDSLIIKIDPYNSELHVVLEKNEMKGIWINHEKGEGYSIPFYARNGNIPRFLESKFEAFNLSGIFQVQFGDTLTGFSAIAELNQNGRIVTGTFRTETGDYRYLEGTQSGDKLFLSCFDGAHAFLFTAQIKKDTLNEGGLLIYNGHFYSGKHYHETWTAITNDSFNLSHPDSLTYVNQNNSFEFKLVTPQGSVMSLHHPNFKDKVSLIQIMGTWCPNCKDESNYLKTVYEKWSKNDVYILAIAFENGRNLDRALSRISNFKTQMKIPYDLFYGGVSDKSKVNEVFPSLSSIVSFPTLIVLDKNGGLVKIHTGFNGPATSQYKTFETNMNALIDSLVLSH